MYQSDFARKYYGEGREAGLRDALGELVQIKLGEVSDDDADRIRAIAGEDDLRRVLLAVASARDAAEARAALSPAS